MKKLMLIIFLSVMGVLVTYENRDVTNIQEGIADKVVRFHVIANTDDDYDQDMKLAVRDRVIDYLYDRLIGAADREESEYIIESEIANIQSIAEDVISEWGREYNIEVRLCDTFFPMKIYEEYCFPAGTYRALEVIIGKGDGHNWWCVMYPPMCLIDTVYAVNTEESDNRLRGILTEEEYDALLYKSDSSVKIKFRIIEWIDELI